MKCINCQKDIGDFLFCPYCGTKQEKPKVFCAYCGAEMDEDSVYCNQCGRKSFFVQQREDEDRRRLEAEDQARREKERLASIEAQKRQAEEKAREDEERKRRERIAEKEREKEEAAQKLSAAQERFSELLGELIPDILGGKEIFDLHAPFIKMMAGEAGWDGEETVAAISDFIGMYNDFRKSSSGGRGFSASERKLLAYRSSQAHIDETVLDRVINMSI